MATVDGHNFASSQHTSPNKRSNKPTYLMQNPGPRVQCWAECFCEAASVSTCEHFVHSKARFVINIDLGGKGFQEVEFLKL
jgi:hypothetical protein